MFSLLHFMTQFDWLLTRQDFPVLPKGNTQSLLPDEAATRAEFQTVKSV
jgi:hypothetical protein